MFVSIAVHLITIKSNAPKRRQQVDLAMVRRAVERGRQEEVAERQQGRKIRDEERGHYILLVQDVRVWQRTLGEYAQIEELPLQEEEGRSF